LTAIKAIGTTPDSILKHEVRVCLRSLFEGYNVSFIIAYNKKIIQFVICKIFPLEHPGLKYFLKW
jgi:hypothetical protein